MRRRLPLLTLVAMLCLGAWPSAQPRRVVAIGDIHGAILLPLAAEHDAEMRHRAAAGLAADPVETHVRQVMLAAGIEKTADDIGVVLGVATAAGIAAHPVSTNIRKKKLISEEIEKNRIAKIEKEEGVYNG